ncbi:DUF6506 family protein [Inquilinus limosus]|uniref:DUF6506 family protein n=1 Tax=Inquilinus limosus TaxID=171674 RepID=UPI0003FFB1C3|nr:DUF6506 family protein [Inquilinus limosus]
MRHQAFLYLGIDADPETDRITRERAGGRMTIIGLSDPKDAPRIAAALARDGVDRIALCGGFALPWRARVAEAVAGRAVAGLVGYAFESLTGVAAYKAGFEAGRPGREALISLEPGADPAVDRTVRERDGHHTTIVAVPDADAAVRIATDLVAEGVTLIELFGDFDSAAASRVIEAVDGRCPVGSVGYGTEVLAG